MTLLLYFCVPSAALSEPEICYVLDGILFLYGIILTALYCRIKVCKQNIFFAEICIHLNGMNRRSTEVLWYVVRVWVKNKVSSAK